jgi:orotate phosphoribosyltransferase
MTEYGFKKIEGEDVSGLRIEGLEPGHYHVEYRYGLLALLRERAVLCGDFILTSGRRSPYYLDARLVTLSAAGSRLVGLVLLSMLPDDIDAVAGLTLGADPIVTAVALTSAQQGRPIDGLIVRKEAKTHGAGRRIEGPWRVGLRVAIVDDTLTTGGSSLQAAQAVVEEGGHVCGVYALIDREQGAREAIEAAGHPFYAAFTAAEIITA